MAGPQLMRRSSPGRKGVGVRGSSKLEARNPKRSYALERTTGTQRTQRNDREEISRLRASRSTSLYLWIGVLSPEPYALSPLSPSSPPPQDPIARPPGTGV